MQHEPNLHIASTNLSTETGATHSLGRLAVAAGIVALFIVGAGSAQVATDAGGARTVTAMSADQGVPHNLLTAMAADEGTPHNLVTAMKADEGVPHNLIAGLPMSEGSPFKVRLALQADGGAAPNPLTA